MNRERNRERLEGATMLLTPSAALARLTAYARVALFVALSGTALALQRNSVGPRELKPDAVRSEQT